MGLWSIVIPEQAEVTNLVTNPSVEYDTTGYTEVGGAIARSIAFGRRGAYGLDLQVTAGVNDGVYYGTVTLTLGETYTASVDLLGQTSGGDVPWMIYFATTAGVQKGTPGTLNSIIGTWQRMSTTWEADANGSFRIYVVKNNSANAAGAYIDGLLCVHLDHDVVYFDGDSPDCRWSGMAHGSTSVAEVQARQIGEVVRLSDINVSIGPIDGVGLVQSAHHVSQRSLLPGAEYSGSKVLPRSFLMTAGIDATSKAVHHSRRKALIEAIKHDLVPGDKPFALRYHGANAYKDAEIRCVVDTEASKLFSPYWQDIALRLTAYDPYFYDTGDTIAQMDGNDSDTMLYFGARVDKEWSAITPSAMTDPGSGIQVLTVALTNKNQFATGSKGMPTPYPYSRRIWIGGAFLNMSGIANADYIGYYDFDDTDWHAAGTGMNGNVYDIVIGPDGSIYACGAFTTAGGGAANYIAKWNGSAWSALGSGLNGAGRCMAFGPDGNLYVGGEFTTAGGTTVNYFAKWDGSAWSALDTSLNGIVYGIAIAANGDVYLTGAFTTTGLVRICKWNGTALSGLGTGLNGNGRPITIAANGDVYVGGAFTTANGVSCAYIARWNGQTFYPLGDGLSGGNCYNLAFDAKGLLYASGDFTAAGGLATPGGTAMWNGSSWVSLDLDLPGTPLVGTLETFRDDLFIGYNVNGTAYHSEINTINNSGTARVYPRLVIKRSGGTSAKLEYLKNETVGAAMWFDQDIQDGETIVIDFSEGNRQLVSSFYGNIAPNMLRGSQFSRFYLNPGDNLINMYISTAGSPSIVAYLQWVNRYESIDGVAA